MMNNSTSMECNPLDNCRPFIVISVNLICPLGFLGNGLVIWLLAFSIKRNPFTTYILNLSIADLGFLITESIMLNPISQICNKYAFLLFITMAQFMHSASQYFLTVISMDRCVSVFFPIWYRLHLARRWPAIFCAVIWVISFLPPGIGFMGYVGAIEMHSEKTEYQIIVNGFLCFPLMGISSLLLVSKVCSRLEKTKQRKLLIMILLNVLFFFILSFPINFWYICKHLLKTKFEMVNDSDLICACLNSSVNPIIYCLVGRPKMGCSMKSLKRKLQGLFSGEELSVQPTEKVEIPLE